MWTTLFDTVNGIGGVIEHSGFRLVRFEPVALLDTARRRTGLDDFGDPAFREPFERLVEAYASAPHLTTLGRVAARVDLLRLLTNRLRLVEDRKRNPGIAKVPVERPIFIVSLPRTGTTYLHGLLAADPANRIPRSWEVMYPSPPPADAPPTGSFPAGTTPTNATPSKRDPRVARVRREFGWFHRMAPEYQAAHPIGPELGQECMAITELSFESPRFDRTHRLPGYREWLNERDRLHSYRIHREVLQHLSWRGPRGRWVLKNPPHSFWLDALWTIYPDARFVQTHRDPFTVMASFASHNSRIRRSFTRPDDTGEGPVVAERWAMGMERVMAFRDRADVPPDRWLDVAYPDLMTDPLGVVRRTYEHFGLPLDDGTEGRMRAYIEAHPQYEHGVHDYDPRRFGLDPERHGALFARYRERFGIEATAEDRRLAETGSKGVGR